MPVQDTKLLPESNVAEHLLTSGITTANSLTGRPFAMWKPGYNFVLSRLGLFCRTETGAAAIDARIARGDGVLNSPVLAIDATPEKFQSGAFSFIIAGQLYSKAAATAEVFSAAYVVATASKWGAFLVQINTSGTVSTKAVGTPQAYATEAEAILALPAPDASKAAMGYITVQSKAGATWTATTDDMTDGSDCTEANFYSLPDGIDGAIVAIPAAQLAAVGGKYVEATLDADYKQRIGTADDYLILAQTTDGTGAMTDAVATAGIRPFPLNGQSMPAVL